VLDILRIDMAPTPPTEHEAQAKAIAAAVYRRMDRLVLKWVLIFVALTVTKWLAEGIWIEMQRAQAYRSATEPSRRHIPPDGQMSDAEVQRLKDKILGK
jgi:streptomycin 6-kinase